MFLRLISCEASTFTASKPYDNKVNYFKHLRRMRFMVLEDNFRWFQLVRSNKYTFKSTAYIHYFRYEQPFFL
jgi:hypothetical protein